jgi:hypothetical protein
MIRDGREYDCLSVTGTCHRKTGDEESMRFEKSERESEIDAVNGALRKSESGMPTVNSSYAGSQ